MTQLALSLSIAASLGAAAIHFALGPHHVEELGALGMGFYLAGMLQVAVPAALYAARNRAGASFRSIVGAGIAINAAILAAWVVSRVVGLPAGPKPWIPEAIGVADSVSAGMEILSVALGIVLLRLVPTSTVAAPAPGRGLQSLAMLPAIALIAVATAFAVLSPEGVASHGADGHTHDVTDARPVEALGPEPTAGHDHVADETEPHAH